MPSHAARPAPHAAAALQGVVTRVDDGNTLWLSPAGQPPLTVRLRDSDAPEICQIWGEEARRALVDLALNKAAVLHSGLRDAKGRVVGNLQVDGADIATRLVEDGNAWSARTRYDRGPLVKQERMARSLQRGLHAAPPVLRPEDFRRSHGPCAAAVPRS